MRLSRIQDSGLRSRIEKYSLLLEYIIDLGMSSIEEVYNQTERMTRITENRDKRAHFEFCVQLTKDALELRKGLDELEQLSSEVVRR